MPLTKSNRMQILLAIDVAFFLLELIVGYAVHSLALVADSFHMFNDVLSLCVGLWAVKRATQTTNSKMYTYGWQRAETLGALVNGVFLVALCVTIFLEAIQRFVEPQEVKNPKLVLIVGSLGLASNVVGLFLFHDHSHSHGGGGHGHSHKAGDEISAAEEGHGHGHVHVDLEDERTREAADPKGNIADVLPESRIASWPQTRKQSSISAGGHRKNHVEFTRSDEDLSTAAEGLSPTSTYTGNRRGRRRSRVSSRRFSTADDIQVHPASFRNEIIAAGRLHDIDSDDCEESIVDEAIQSNTNAEPTETTALIPNGTSKPNRSASRKRARRPSSSYHKDHIHTKPKKDSKSGGHSHDLNMRGVFLHVLGDALGNIGVISSALIIWLTKFSWRFYSDPAISLVITAIILASAIPLCKAASRILLQGVPPHISVDDIMQDIQDLPGIVSCHHVHVWQLSDTKIVASLHIQVGFGVEGEWSKKYMELARQVRKCLQEYGIESSTIQPEFCINDAHDHSVEASTVASSDEEHDGQDGEDNGKKVKKSGSQGHMKKDSKNCLLECDGGCGGGDQCCAPDGQQTKGHGKRNSDAHDHDRGHGHEHGHEH